MRKLEYYTLLRDQLISQADNLLAWRNPSQNFGKSSLFFGVTNHNALGHRQQKRSAPAGGVGGDAPDGIGERTDHQQPPVINGPFHIGGITLRQTPRGGEDNRLTAAQKEAEYIAFKGGVKTGYYAFPGFARFLRPVVDAQNRMGGVISGAEEGGFATLQYFGIAEGVYLRLRGRVQTLLFSHRVTFLKWYL